MWNISQEAMSLCDMLMYVAIIKTTKMMLTNEFNSKDVGVVDMILEIKFSNTSDGLVLSQLHERCDDSLMRSPYAKSMCVLYILVGHKVMVGLDIFVRDLKPWGNCSQMVVVPDYKMDP